MRVIVAIGVLLMLSSPVSAALTEGDEVLPLSRELERQLEGESDELQAFYAARDARPAWQNGEQVAAFAAALHTLDRDGLDPQDYRPDRLLAQYRQLAADDEARARFELAASRSLLTALEHLQRGKVDPYAIDPAWEVPIRAPALDMASVSQAVDGQRFEQAFEQARPDYAPYERLRAGLARYRNIQRLGGWPTLPERDVALRPGDVHADVERLRERLAIIGELEVMAVDAAQDRPDPQRFDDALAAAVKRFQRRHLLEVDGIVGRETRAALNVPVARRIDQIRLNLERARWLLHGLPEVFVLVDIAGYRLSYFRPSGDIWRSRIVVGRPYRRTPSLRSEITHLTVNPSWTIPPTILRQDVLPKVREDLGYLWRERIQVLSPSGEPLDPWSIDWASPGNVILRQAPGPNNALGRVVIRFPNDHLVYLHDTPAQGLFARQQRAFSSGCIRVEQAETFAQRLLDDTGTERNLAALIASGDTRNVSLARHVPVVLHYWTVHPSEDGALAFRPDIYDRDDALLEALDRPLTP
ncbi:L,D-transpeptidase family protein [Billgrantia gudaonensis]|uniref:Murein L,D-transpeptidase YcbB/YkuD n=1 Tax=Billgrantia gudaonensis TaxID=376427 RepID=A0A1G8ZQE7_9GAMM|nr:L,D-transpeptidase family protein [Halomonas gudaonensis]SDK16794.1 Murein L,D-transpeptidase YcbB/YkuD [Halomonas gudaonensis]